MEKGRLDKFLNTNKMAISRDRSISLIKSWSVSVNWKVITKPSYFVSATDKIVITNTDFKWVSRAWLKLEKAFKKWKIDVSWKICADIWASTWGFCDVLLEWYTERIYAVDVWHSQLHQKIKSCPKVINLEKTNARSLTSEHIPEKLDFFCSDVSFISITKIIPSIWAFLKPWWAFVILIKPQFELYPSALNSKWIVKNSNLQKEAVDKVLSFVSSQWYKIIWLTESPIKWWDWNTEYLLYAKK